MVSIWDLPTLCGHQSTNESKDSRIRTRKNTTDLMVEISRSLPSSVDAVERRKSEPRRWLVSRGGRSPVMDTIFALVIAKHQNAWTEVSWGG